MSRSFQYIVCFLFLMVISMAAKSQPRMDASREFGLVFGTAYYIGDLNQTHFGGNLKLGAGAMYRENFNKRWSLKAQFFYGQVGASDADSDDPWMVNRNLSFKNEIMEGALQAELNYIDYQIANKRARFSPYLFLGIAYYSHKPQAEYLGKWYELQPLGTEGQGTTEGPAAYKLSGIAFPFGLGFKFNLFSIVAISGEWGMRKTYTDYLDDVSGSYVSQQVLQSENGQLSAALADRSLSMPDGLSTNDGLARGDSGRNDWYSFTTLTLSFRLGKPPTSCDWIR